MTELLNCPNCGSIYVKNKFREVCEACFKKEEKTFEEVYRFLRQRENRAATPQAIAERIGVEVALLYKWVRKGRLNVRQFTNLGFPCERCGDLIQAGKVCASCVTDIKKDLQSVSEDQERKKARQQSKTATYRTFFQEE
ncbi:TIGR03826 family flagellar region protein [Bacillus spongiae]|uniref:TIGR03826 family flagellar region protein n=2 Tax=Bacillus spongiae TaxID=2683610 RepID=A0ABU8HEX0_9BACI